MANEHPGEHDEVVSEHKVKLVTADPGTLAINEKLAEVVGGNTAGADRGRPQSVSVKESATLGSAASIVNTSAGVRPDPQRIMHELSSDEFFKVLEESTPEQLQALIHTFEKGSATTGSASFFRRIVEVPAGKRSIFSIFLWWESRRLAYNLIVGLSGLPSVLILSLFGLAFPAAIATFFYALCANVCYCLGAPAEIIAGAVWKEKANHSGSVLLTLGTIFSVILTVFLELLVLCIFLYSAVSPRF
ncbi:MAG: hypothetical protein K2Y39_12845 [Candidatus Obscuribacterales bacterium]|nr:hypothetical protein [Candidatus Obscuribacterales bacterium]